MTGPDTSDTANELEPTSGQGNVTPLHQPGGPNADPPPFLVRLDAFDGPLDLLLDLVRRDKVDLAKVSILRLTEQYLAYLEAARRLKLEVAAEYLVMAAWLALLKSRLLLPKEEREEDDPLLDAEALAERLERLARIRGGAEWLRSRPALGVERLVRGAPEPLKLKRTGAFTADLGRLLTVNARMMGRRGVQRIRLVPRAYLSIEAALERLSRLVTGAEWQDLRDHLPPHLEPGAHARAAVAASLVAGLELARRGEIELRQDRPFGPLMVRRLGPPGPFDRR